MYVPNFQLPTVSTLTNAGGYNRTFNGIEVTAAEAAVEPLADEHELRVQQHDRELRRLPRQHQRDVDDVRGGDRRPDEPRPRGTGSSTTIRRAGSGIGNIYVNAKWLFKLSGMYQMPYAVNVSAFYNARQGYPFERFVQGPSRASTAAARPAS